MHYQYGLISACEVKNAENMEDNEAQKSFDLADLESPIDLLRYKPVITLDTISSGKRTIDFECPDSELAKNCQKAIVNGDLKNFKNIGQVSH